MIQKYFEYILSNLKKNYKIYLLIMFISIELLLFLYSRSLLNHRAIQINRSGINLSNQELYLDAEKKYLEASSYNFRKNKILYNYAFMNYKKKDYGESIKILNSIEESDILFKDAYSLQGHTYFEIGKSLLNKVDCNYQETIPIWELSKKKFFYSKLLSILYLDFQDFKLYDMAIKNVESFILYLPEWRKNCLNPPEGSDGGESNNNMDSNSKINDNLSNDNQVSSDPKNRNHENKHSERKKLTSKESENRDTRNKMDEKGNIEKFTKFRDKLFINREKKKSEETLSSEEMKILDTEKEKIRKSQNYSDKEFIRFQEEIDMVRDIDDMKKILEKAKW